MLKATNILFLIVFPLALGAQTTADFEQFNLQAGQFLNDATPEPGFSSANLLLPNDYNPDWDAWTGWAISATTDVTTPGYGNQYSAIAGSGANGSVTYAVSYAYDPSVMIFPEGARPQGFYLTNSTYAYLSMLEGDAVSKRFGGETGDDPDFFLLTIRKYHDGVLGDEKVEFYLADYRFADNNQDYIIDDWTYVDLSPLGEADSLSFSLTSSDQGNYGMNTPAYFCVDDVVTTAIVAVRSPVTAWTARVFPNPTADVVRIEAGETGRLWVVNAQGQTVNQYVVDADVMELPVSSWPAGSYTLLFQAADGQRYRQVLLKH
jgi:hypothetical protein